MVNKTLIHILLIFGLTTCISLVSLWLWISFHQKDKSVSGIYVSELLITVSNERYHTDYCKVLKKAVGNDPVSIKKLVLLEFYGGSSYDHGSVIVELIALLGEDTFLKAISSISYQQKKHLAAMIRAGLEFGNNPKLQDLSFEEAFPHIFDYVTLDSIKVQRFNRE